MSSEIIEHPEFTVYDVRGYFYVPFVSSDGRVGYRVAAAADASRETFVYMNPSDGGDEDVTPDIFIYEGVENDPVMDGSVVFVVPESIL